MTSTIQEEQKSAILNAMRNETLSIDMDSLEIDEDKIEELTVLPESELEKKSSGENEAAGESTGEDPSKEAGTDEADTDEAGTGETGTDEAGNDEAAADETSIGENTQENSPEEAAPGENEEEKTSGEEEETVSGTEQPFSLTGFSKSSYIAIGALLVALILIVIRRITSQKHADTKGQKDKAEASEKTDMETEAASASQNAEKESRTTPSGIKEPYSVGKVHAIGARKDQQDSYHISDYMDRSVLSEKGFLAIVADGMGGLSNGGAVSKLAVNTGMEYFYGSPSSLTPGKRLLEMAQVINNRINQFLRGRRERSGSTLVEALIYQDKLYFLTIGDSRIYLYRGGHMICLNRPHVYAEELALESVNQQRSLSDMDQDRQKASLTSYLGAGRLKYLDRNMEGITLAKGDKIMLCSDGVFGTLNEESMELALSKNPEEAAELLEQQVYVAGKKGQDNFTAVIIQCN